MTAEWLLNQASVCINNSSGGRRELHEAAVLEAERKWAPRAGCQWPCIMILPSAPQAEAEESECASKIHGACFHSSVFSKYSTRSLSFFSSHPESAQVLDHGGVRRLEYPRVGDPVGTGGTHTSSQFSPRACGGVPPSHRSSDPKDKWPEAAALPLQAGLALP